MSATGDPYNVLKWCFQAGETPAEQMRRFLMEYRTEGRPFPSAWACALARVKFASARDQADWLKVWEDIGVQAAWMAGYERRFNFAAHSVGALRDMQEEVRVSEIPAEPTPRGMEGGARHQALPPAA